MQCGITRKPLESIVICLPGAEYNRDEEENGGGSSDSIVLAQYPNIFFLDIDKREGNIQDGNNGYDVFKGVQMGGGGDFGVKY